MRIKELFFELLGLRKIVLIKLHNISLLSGIAGVICDRCLDFVKLWHEIRIFSKCQLSE